MNINYIYNTPSEISRIQKISSSNIYNSLIILDENNKYIDFYIEKTFGKNNKLLSYNTHNNIPILKWIDKPSSSLFITNFNVTQTPQISGFTANRILLNRLTTYSVSFNNDITTIQSITLDKGSVSNITKTSDSKVITIDIYTTNNTSKILSFLLTSMGKTHNLTYTVSPVTALQFNQLDINGTTRSIDTFVKHQKYDLLAILSKKITTTTTYTITTNTTNVPLISNSLNFQWQPSVREKLRISNVTDLHGFTYSEILTPEYNISVYFNEYNDFEFLTNVIKGIHFDIEPHTTPEWDIDLNSVANQFIDLLEGCMTLINGVIPLIVDIPAWYHTKLVTREGITKGFNEYIQDLVSITNIFAFRDTSTKILDFSLEEMTYAINNNKKVRLSVETNEIPSEPSYITFYGKNYSYMDTHLTIVNDEYKNTNQYDGIMIQDYDGWKGIIKSDLSSNGNSQLLRHMYIWEENFYLDEIQKQEFYSFRLSHPVKSISYSTKPYLQSDTFKIAKFMNSSYMNGIDINFLFGGKTEAFTSNHQTVYDWINIALTFTVTGKNFKYVESSSYFILNNVTISNNGVKVYLTGIKTVYNLRLVSDNINSTYPGAKTYTSLSNGNTLNTGETDFTFFFLENAISYQHIFYISFTIGLTIYTTSILYNP